MANTEKVRLNKYLSQAGICSRREADVLIEGGKDRRSGYAGQRSGQNYSRGQTGRT